MLWVPAKMPGTELSNVIGLGATPALAVIPRKYRHLPSRSSDMKRLLAATRYNFADLPRISPFGLVSAFKEQSERRSPDSAERVCTSRMPMIWRIFPAARQPTF
jgi:hypothetical protein